MLAQKFLNYLPERISNQITNLVTHKRSIKYWDNRLLGLSSLPIRTIIDIGANEGVSIQKLSSIFPDAYIYAFEPCQLPFQILEGKFGQNSNISIFNYALGNEMSMIQINDYVGATQASSILKISSEAQSNNPVLQRVRQYEVQQYTLDELNLNLKTEVLLKVDVQGYELEVLKGAEMTLKQSKACIVEINNGINYQNQCSFREIFLFLDKLDFSYEGNIDQVFSKEGKVEYFDAIFVKN